MVTHNQDHLATADAVIEITDGRIATLADRGAPQPGVRTIATTR
jgi:putative ABC transport system ATP-binding protein